jgi:uncharacterized membrane protein
MSRFRFFHDLGRAGSPGSIAMTKTLTFAVVHFTVAFSVGYLLTGSIVIGGLLALVEPAVNTVAYYLHEQAWKRVERRRVHDGRVSPQPA